MFDSIFLFFAIAVFVAVVLGLEGSYMWWNARRGPEAMRMVKRAAKTEAKNA